jgi:acyl-CoA hydrolase
MNTGLTYDKEWKTRYQDLIATPAQAVSMIGPGQRVFVGTGCAQPEVLVQALTARADELPGTEIVHLLTQGEAPYTEKKMRENFRVNSFFIAENVRDVIQQGMGDYTPIFLSEIPRLFASGQIPLDVALIQITPPDERGICSLGVSVDIVKSAAENAAMVIAQVNPRMPRTMGDCTLHVEDIDVLVAVDLPILEYHDPKPDEITRKIGENVASLVEDGATIELGIGHNSMGVVEFLHDKKDLGLHTEMISDSIVGLIEAGVVTGERKSLDAGKHVVSFCMGTDRLYQFIDNNPSFSFRPT